MSFTAPQPRPLSELLWHHYRWHLWLGLALWMSTALPLIFFDYMAKRAMIFQNAFYDHNRAFFLNNLARESAWFAAMCLLVGLAFAAIEGVLRHPFLVLLSRHARTRKELVWKSLVLFELLIFLSALIPWPIAYNQFSVSMVGHQFLACFLVSLPWLITTGLASRKLAAALALPHDSK